MALTHHSLLSSCLLLVACGGHEPAPPRPEVLQPTAPAPAPAVAQVGDTAQIAEYVVAVFEDRKGTLWFGTINKGVARFDGRSLTYLTSADGLCGDTVPTIAEDKAGNLWFGTHSGVCKYDGVTFTTLLATEGHVRAGRDGDIWLSSQGRVYRHDGRALSRFDVPIASAEIRSYSISRGRVSMALEDSKGNLWFATDGYGALRYDGKSFTHFDKRDGLSSNTVTRIMEDARGDIWFACIQSHQPAPTGDGGVSRYDGKTFTGFPGVEGLSKNDIYTIYEERSGAIWIGAPNRGAYRYDGKTFTLFDQTDRRDLTTHFGVQGILEDRRGTLWFGFSGGLFRFDGSAFVNVTQGGPWPSAP